MDTEEFLASLELSPSASIASASENFAGKKEEPVVDSSPSHTTITHEYEYGDEDEEV